ncbi:transcriptional regulator, MarR family [Bryocella elongata]|uniref:Transcriptional regulator, MarR family n=1 Tax=Bryocella elongata TaxID=863522 RepID=A0A1H6CCK5_9BACT|nr:MarR family transcriptional regulator [Bryocella elongata]SEG70365.1 transcriptional regulator, MarR family [Bryocella elongata]
MSKTEQTGNDTTGPKLWVVLARAYGALAHYVEQCIAAEGLCLSDFMMLEVLLHKGPLSISAIGEKVLLTNASMTAATDRLEKRGFVERHNSEEDRRSKIVTLTPEGRTFISELYERHVKDIEAVTSVLSQKEQNKMRGLLKTLGLAAKEASERKREAADAEASAPIKDRARVKKA